MFQVYHSNSLLVLKDLLVELIRRSPLEDPFRSEKILVQSPGMAQWLKLEIASAQGIAAAVDFPLPASFLWSCFSDVLKDVPERSAYNKEAMSWKLMMILPELLGQEEFSSLQQYLQDDRESYRLYQLCNKIADIFDQYLVYRPDWISDWESGGGLAAGRHPWQPVLWRALKNYTEQREQSHWHRANMFSAFISALSSDDIAEKLPARLFVFGISALPQNYIQALQALGQKIDVHLMVTNPCQYYWGDIVDQSQVAKLNRQWFSKEGMEFSAYAEGNPLLASMGKLGRDYLFQLQEHGIEEITAFADPERGSLLRSIQQDILELENPANFPDDPSCSQHKQPVKLDDHSLTLHSCHSPLREVEILHDQLLAMFASTPDLQPRDLIVMMPDVAAYSPYIDAVFSNAAAKRYIPYSISDRSNSQENPLLLNFAKLLKLQESRFTVSDVLELLEVPAVMRRFNLDDDGFQKLRLWIADTNIRWGMDSEHRSLWELPLFEQNSWTFGLRRMLVGYALGDQDDLWNGISPYAEIEGLNAELLGKLVEFIDRLEHTRSSFERALPFAEWVNEINQLLDDFYQPDEQDEIALSSIRKTLQNLHEQLSDAGFSEPLTPVVISDYLIDGINNQSASQRFMVGAVNFCTLMPMRSIPFKVVCLLGMNDGAYPRSIPPVGFDLMSDYPRRGDRSRRDDDRYLFLEALLSAREKLYISFVGRSIKDNSERIPSVLLSELLDYIQSGYVLNGDENLSSINSGEKLCNHLILQHPLTAFSPAYFNQDEPRLFSYAEEWLPAAAVNQHVEHDFITQALSEELPEVLELSELINFLKTPCRSFFNQRLKVFFYHDDIEAQDEEPFALDGLSAYLIKQHYLDAALEGQNLEHIDQQMTAEGCFPVGQIGELQRARIRHDCEVLAEKIKPLQEGEAKRLEIDLQVGKTRLQGWLNNCYENHQLSYRPAEVNARDRLSSWVIHLSLCASGYGCRNTVFRGLSGKVYFRAVPEDEAIKHLQALVDFYVAGMAQPQPFDAGCAHDYFTQLQKDPEKASFKVESRFYGSAFSMGLIQDPYFRRCFTDFEIFYTGFTEQAQQLYQPLLNYAEEGKDD
ncbi:MAG: exodeoxyribonuclease V subunit gamma [Neptuniibacter sp.]